MFHGLVTEGADGCAALRVVHFDVSDEGITFLRHNGDGVALLPFTHMRVRKAGCGRKGTSFQGKSHFPILYVKDFASVAAIQSRAPSRVYQQFAALTPKPRRLLDSLRIAAGGVVMVVAMLWAIPSI